MTQKKRHLKKSIALKTKKCYKKEEKSVVKTSEEIIMENLKTIEEWALQGMSQRDMAECLGIGYSTFRKIKGQNVALIALLRKSAKARKNMLEDQVKEVEHSLFERAKGYDEKKKVFFKVKKKGIDENGNKYEHEEVHEREIIEHVQADIQAAKFFLTNMAKKVWQENPHKVKNDSEVLELRKKELEKNDIF